MLHHRRLLVPLFLLASACVCVARADVVGKVVAVSDGDTLRVLDADGVEHRVRLTGIDAPERGQPFGTASRKHLASLVAGKEVHVEASRIDRYGRVLGKVRVQPADCADCGKTLDANLAQVLDGMAWWYEYYADQQPPEDRERYKSAAIEARQRRRGLWREPEPIPPWAWRRGTRSPTDTPAAAAFRCGSKSYCREMTSCEEARFYLEQCGLTRLDGNRDGVPCNSLCRQ